MTTNQTKNQLKEIILKTIHTEKPQNTKQLIQLMQQHHNIPPEETIKLLTELENQNRLNFTKHPQPTPASLKTYVVSKNATWFWTTIALAAATAIAVFTIPETAYPIVYLRQALGAIFILFLPGFTFIKALFPSKLPIQTSKENLHNIERVALSLGMSLVFAPIVGLILNYTPWGIRLIPIILSLLAFTIVFASAAILREYRAKLKQSQSAHIF